MGSGFNFFTNAIDVTPNTAGSWVDVDVSAYIPSGSTGVILKISETTTTAYRAEVRKNGSSDDFGLYIGGSNGRYVLVGVDANRIFEAYIGNVGVKIYLVGYADENCGFFDNAVNKTPTTVGSWVDVDVSGNIPSNATGVICMLYNTSTNTNYSVGIRKNGSSDEFTYGAVYQNKRFSYQLCGVDANRIFEAKIQNAAVRVYLIGYTKSPITFFNNAIDKSLGTTGSWLDIDVTSDTNPAADGAILFIKNTGTTQYRGDVRKNGSSDNHTPMYIFYGSCVAGLCGMDSNQIFEGYIANLSVDFYLIGYCKPSGITYEISLDTVSKSLTTPTYETTFNIAKDIVVNSQGLPVQESIFNIMKDASINSEGLPTEQTTFNLLQDTIVKSLAESIIEVVSVLSIFVDASTRALTTSQIESTFNINKDAIIKALTDKILQSTFNIDKNTLTNVSLDKVIESTFNINKNAVINTLSDKTLESIYNISKDVVVNVLADKILESIYNISLNAQVQVQSIVDIQVITQAIEIFLDATIKALSTVLTETQFNIFKEAIAKALAKLAFTPEEVIGWRKIRRVPLKRRDVEEEYYVIGRKLFPVQLVKDVLGKWVNNIFVKLGIEGLTVNKVSIKKECNGKFISNIQRLYNVEGQLVDKVEIIIPITGKKSYHYILKELLGDD